MQFPKDHYTHDSTIEWWYFWGRFPDKTFFTLATFRAGHGNIQSRSTHWSLHNHQSNYFEELEDDLNRLNYGVEYLSKGNRWAIESKHFALNMKSDAKPVIHESVRNYYTIPSMKATGHIFPDNEIECDVWMDHEFGRYHSLSSWDWIAVKLDCGLNIMVSTAEDKKISMIYYQGILLHSGHDLDGYKLHFHDLGMKLHLQPTIEERIFSSRFGIPYSDQPFDVYSGKKVIGYGIRERAYKEKENG